MSATLPPSTPAPDVSRPVLTRDTPRWMVILGWLIATPPVGLLLMGGIMKVMLHPTVVEGMSQGGWPDDVARPLGIVELACTVLYLIPRTAVLGAVLLTGYLGGAVATHVHAGDAFTGYLFPALFGVVLWLGLFLRDSRVRALLPLRRPRNA